MIFFHLLDKSAARLMTKLEDQMYYSGDDLTYSTNWIEKNIDDIPRSSDDAAKTKVDFEICLRNIRLAVERLETLLPEVRAALTSLKDVTVADATEDIEKTLQKVGIHVAECPTLVLFSSFIWC